MRLLEAEVSEVGEGWRVKEAPYGEKRPSEPAWPPFTPTETSSILCTTSMETSRIANNGSGLSRSKAALDPREKGASV